MKRLRRLMLSGTIVATAVCAVPPVVTYGKGGPPHKPPPKPTRPDVSINSTSANSDSIPRRAVSEQPIEANEDHTILGANDLGMHCGDLDTRIASILPPFNTVHAQVIAKGRAPEILDGDAVDVFYSAASSPFDIVFDPLNPQPPGYDVVGGGDPFTGVYKTNFWGALNAGAYNPFYPFDIVPPSIPVDLGLPVPDPAFLPELQVGQQAMPGIKNPYQKNDPQWIVRFDTDLQFFVGFPFGYEQTRLDWFSGDGIPLTTFDDAGRVNPYPLMRLQATERKNHGRPGKVLASVDTVTPVSGEANCKNCHTSNDPSNSNVGAPTYPNTDSVVNPIGLNNSSLQRTVSVAFEDPAYGQLPVVVSVEYAQDLNLLRFHDNANGPNYVDSAGNPVPCVTAPDQPADNIETCLTYKATHGEPVVCQRCHYTPALDLAQVGPLGGSTSYDDGTGNGGIILCPTGTDPNNCVANGRTQRVQPTMSRVIHKNAHSGSSRFNAFNMPPPDLPDIRNTPVSHDGIAPPSVVATSGTCVYNADGTLGWPANSYARYECTQCAEEGKTVAECAVESTCYQCHPGKYTKCLRGAMANAGMLCQDCHGSMAQVGDDFSEGFSHDTPFPLGANLTKRIPWATEPGCQSCHVGDAINQPADTTGFIYDDEGIRLLQAWRAGDPDASPIASPNSRFAEDQTPLEFGETGPTKRVLYRLSRGQRFVRGDTTGQAVFTGHNGVLCEGCHGSTHAEWPVAPDAPNDGAWPPPKGSFVANDNVTAGQLQGHTGKIIECEACHTGDFSLQNGLGGPHGIHPVGGTDNTGYSQWWVDNHGHYLNGRITEETFLSTCGVCHGDVAANARGTGTGSPLAEMAQERTVDTFRGPVTLAKDHKVICGDCHGGVPLLPPETTLAAAP